MKNNSIKRRIAESIDIQSDFMTDCVMLRLRGKSELVIENYKGILEYSDKKICVRTKPENLSVTGDSLEIRIITDEILCITGKIRGVYFISEGEL